MTDIAFDRRVLVPDHIKVRDLLGEAVILDENRGFYFSLDEVGTRMWYLLTTSPSIQVAFDALRAEYAVDEPRLRADIATLVGTLLAEGLLRMSEP